MRQHTWLRSFLILINILLLSFATCAVPINNTKTDSLQEVINTKTGADKISSQLDLALQLINTNKKEALSVSISALSGARVIGHKNLEMQSYFVLGKIYTELDNHQLSLAYLDSALQINSAINDKHYKGEILFHIGVNMHRLGESIQALESINAAVRECCLTNNYRILGSSYSMMGTIFRVNGFYDRAIEYIIKSKLNYEKADFVEGSAWAAYLLGRIYSDLKLPEKALEYSKEALNTYIGLAATDGNQNGVAICYEQIGLLNLELGNFEEARANIDKTRKIHAEYESKYGMSNVHKHLGRIEYSKGNYASAQKYFNEAMEVKKELNDLLSLPAVYEYLGLCQIKRGNTQKGFINLKHGLDLAISNNQRKMQLDIYAKLSEAYLSLNDLENALTYQNKQIELQNLILSGDANIKIEQLQAIYEIDEKNSQIAELEKENEINALSIKQNRTTRNLMITGIILALFISIVIIWFNRKIRHKNRELKESNAAKDKFFAIIAHDLRGPTAALAGLLEHLNSRFDEFSKDQLKEILFTLYKSAESVSSLLENLLIWAQSQVNRIECRPKELKLSKILQSSAQGLNSSAGNKQIDISFELNDQLVVFADPDMVQTIVRNIIGNAIKFTHRGGAVKIQSAAKDTKHAIIRISDNGVGIDKSTLKKLFDISHTLHTAGTENEKSTGLGLILINDFVARNKGALSIESEKDKGTTVSFTLPLV